MYATVPASISTVPLNPEASPLIVSVCVPFLFNSPSPVNTLFKSAAFAAVYSNVPATSTGPFTNALPAVALLYANVPSLIFVCPVNPELLPLSVNFPAPFLERLPVPAIFESDVFESFLTVN